MKIGLFYAIVEVLSILLGPNSPSHLDCQRNFINIYIYIYIYIFVSLVVVSLLLIFSQNPLLVL